MFLPWNTDAPIYHFPAATIGLIAVNVAVFAALVAGLIEEPENWILIYGDGLHPLQWVSSNFLHAGYVHLIGNMVFLWGFGLVVEGKIGWWRFLLVFLGIGIVECAFEQAVTQHAIGGSLGASAILYGLLAISLVWAPKNEMSVVFFFMRIHTFDIAIMAFAGIYLGWEAAMLVVTNFGIGPSLLHLMGAVVGLAVGIAMLKLGWVDCENWDLFAVLAGREGKAAPEPVKPQSELKAERALRAAEGHARIEEYLKQGEVAGALAVHRNLSRTLAGWELNEGELVELVRGLEARQDRQTVIPLCVEFVRRWPDRASTMRLKLARALLLEHRPRQASEVLAKLPAMGLTPPIAAARDKLAAHARKQIAEGHVELDSEDW